jgi:ketosteroid isomerase-like protein
MDADRIRKLAQALDETIEKKDVSSVADFFSDDCELEMAGQILKGKEDLKRAFSWIFGHLPEIRLIPITILIEGSTFFEEFLVRTKSTKGKMLQVKQAEVLVYEDDYKVRSLRLYFDRLELGDVFVSNFIEKAMVELLAKASLRGLAS